MTKIRTTITIDTNLLKKAKHHNIRISTFLDRKLRECLSDFSNGTKVFDDTFSKKGEGYDVALTTRRSPVQFRPGPLLLSPGVCVEVIEKHRVCRRPLYI